MRIRIRIGIKMESRIRMQVCIKTITIQNPQRCFSVNMVGDWPQKFICQLLFFMQTVFGMIYAESGSELSVPILSLRTRYKTRPGSGSSKSMLWIRIRIGSGFIGVPGSVPASGFAIIFWSAGCSLLMDDGFSCSLDVSAVIFFFKFCSSKDPYPDPDSMNPDAQHQT